MHICEPVLCRVTDTCACAYTEHGHNQQEIKLHKLKVTNYLGRCGLEQIRGCQLTLRVSCARPRLKDVSKLHDSGAPWVVGVG